MGLMKVSGLPVTGLSTPTQRLNADPPSAIFYSNGQMVLKYYAALFLALTTITDPAAIEKIRLAAEQITTPDEEDWTAVDAERILSAIGAPPLPSHILVHRVPGHGLLTLRAVAPDTKGARQVRYNKKRPTLSLLTLLREEGVAVPQGYCLDVPVKLGLDEQGLVVVIRLNRQKTRALHEVEEKAV